MSVRGDVQRGKYPFPGKSIIVEVNNRCVAIHPVYYSSTKYYRNRSTFIETTVK